MTRDRRKVEFWLDVNRDDESELYDLIAELRRSRQFAPTVKAGLWLMLSLADERLDYLLELAPWAETHLQGQQPSSGFTRIEAAQDDEPVIEVREKEVDAGLAAENFLGSLMALSG